LIAVAQCRVPAWSDDEEETEIQNGLADCQAIVSETFNGQFAVRTAPNDGTTFEISIPLSAR
jgi:sensor histidine kinase regulating citrate/malate metabolism